jgi:hypothetical protein
VTSLPAPALPPALALLLAFAILWIAGCRGPQEGFGAQRQAQRPIQIHVQNNNFLDVTVYARAGSVNLRLGNITGKSSGRLTLDPRRVNLSSGLQLRVDPIGSTRTFLSQAVFPDRGAVVVLEVGAQLEMSFVSLR